MSQPTLDLDLDDHGIPTYSVAELGEAINGALRRRFSDGVWVRGEIQGWNERGPHAYFRLVEETEAGKAAVNVQFFANTRMRLRPILQKHRLRLVDGLEVRIFGHLDFFAPSGQLGLKMSGIDPRFTLGELALQRDDVVRRLVASGLFDANRRRPLPPAPLRIGVVTSIGSAAWHDFVHEIERSGHGFTVRAIDVRVQGDTAVSMISAALRTLGRHDDLDVVVLIRGGGARSELATFDHEAIALAIADSAHPVFTGLGHEVDRSVADEVAHTAWKTPTACAAALVEQVRSFAQTLDARWQAVHRRGTRALQQAGDDLDRLAVDIRHHTTAAVDRADGRFAPRVERLHSGSDRVLQHADRHLDHACASLRRAPQRIDTERRHVDALESKARLLDPVHVMARGWSITRGADGRAVRDVAALRAGDAIVTTFARGSARSTVEEIAP